jgi:ATP-dependent helicase/nuclease subunit A
MNAAPRPADSLTDAQRRAVAARGNVLVMAGAGTGKTRTLVERCLDCLERDGARVDELLVVTFTEAAATEMRERLRRTLEARADEEARAGGNQGAGIWAEQLARFDLAHIGTLHSFCLKLVREHFYELGLDPRMVMLAEGESRQLANETLDGQFAAHYEGEDEFSLAVQNLIESHGGGQDGSLRKMVLRLHDYSQTRPDAAGWLAQQRGMFSSAKPLEWPRWLCEGFHNWRGEWLPYLKSLAAPAGVSGGAANEKAAELAELLEQKQAVNGGEGGRRDMAVVLEQIVAADEQWPVRRKIILRKPLEDIFDEAKFLLSLAAEKDGTDPLAEDWSWVRGPMETLARLAGEFALALDQRKRAQGVLDFHDLEQFALQILWDFTTGKPTAAAETWRAKLRFVFVDEYQDINAAQDKIIQALSREGQAANRFLVGDVKQSIYRFRLADPQIFRDYAARWGGNQGAATGEDAGLSSAIQTNGGSFSLSALRVGEQWGEGRGEVQASFHARNEPLIHPVHGEVIPLSENFRSREDILYLANSLFRLVMREEVGGVNYNADAELKPGPQSGEDMAAARPELLLRFKTGRNGSREEAGSLAGLDDAQCEARLVAQRLHCLMAENRVVHDTQEIISRPLEWRDIAILLRSPSGCAEAFAKEFERAGIPLAVARGGFYQGAEIQDLLSLLQLLDNPLQDIPCIAVLRSPLCGLSLDELAQIRLCAGHADFWTALGRSAVEGLGNAETDAKIALFLERFSRWRKMARMLSLSQCLDEILAETLYADWVAARPRGVSRAANVTAFLQLARQFDQFQRQGLYRFLKFIEAQQEVEAEPEVPAAATGNAVRLMSIHQAKGQEFPVVVLANLGRQFNERDLGAEIILDETFGLCPKVKPPGVGGRYPSLPHWLAQRHQKRELRGEELRLFYVALTRARECLILTASVTEKQWEEKWRKLQPATVRQIASARCFADWLSLWFSTQKPGASGHEGESAFLRWKIVEPPAQLASQSTENQSDGSDPGLSNVPDRLRERLSWVYPHLAAAARRAKVSVTALRREAEELAGEAEPLFVSAEPQPPRRRPAADSKLNAAEVGAAHHKFLEHFALDFADDLPAEASRLVHAGCLAPDEAAALDLDALAAFWNSPPGAKIRAHASEVRRELPFTARFSPLELEKITGLPAAPGLDQEFVIVQGVADLVVLRRDEIWLLDFKTDQFPPRDLPEKLKNYSPQLKLYAAALEKIFARPVTSRTLHFLAARRSVEV